MAARAAAGGLTVSRIPRVPVTGELALREGQVRLSVVIGEAQQGFTVVYVDDEKQGEGEDIHRLLLGDTASLAGRTLYLDTTVTVTNTKTTRTAVTYILEQDDEARRYRGTHTLDAVGDSVIYEGEIRLERAGSDS